MKNQALFSSKDKTKILKCHLLQFLFNPNKHPCSDTDLPTSMFFISFMKGNNMNSCSFSGGHSSLNGIHSSRKEFAPRANSFLEEVTHLRMGGKVVVLLFNVHGKHLWSVNQTTLFLGRLRPPKGLINTLCTCFHQQLTTALLESAEGATKVWPYWVSNPGPLAHESEVLPTVVRGPA